MTPSTAGGLDVDARGLLADERGAGTAPRRKALVADDDIARQAGVLSAGRSTRRHVPSHWSKFSLYTSLMSVTRFGRREGLLSL